MKQPMQNNSRKHLDMHPPLMIFFFLPVAQIYTNTSQKLHQILQAAGSVDTILAFHVVWKDLQLM